jgi:hypothetical protein
MATLAELLSRINTRACNEGDMQKAISNIVNVFNNTGAMASRIAYCTLTTPEGGACTPDSMDVGDFEPTWDNTLDPLPTPTTATNSMNFAIPGSADGLIIYRRARNRWDVLNVFHADEFMLTSIEQDDDLSFTAHFTTVSVPTCNVNGSTTITIDPPPPATVTARVLRELRLNGCSVESKYSDLEVIAKVENAGWDVAFPFTEHYDLMYGWYYSGGVIYGLFIPVYVPCSGAAYQAVLGYTETCNSSGSSG